jgi:hypothetical protein
LRRFSPGLPELWSFRSRIDEYGKLRIYKGLRRVIMVSSEMLAPGSGDEFTFDFAEGHAVWMKWTYRTNPTGASNGAWSGLLSGATPDTDNRTQRVVVLCQMIVRHGLRDVFRHKEGAVEIYDVLNCQSCE